MRAVAIWLVGIALTAIGFVGILTPAFAPFIAWALLLAPIAFMLWAAWDAFRRADTAPAPTAWYQRWYIFVLVALAIGLALQPFVHSGQRRIVDAFRVPSGSMEPGFLIGDYLYADTRTSARVGVTRGSPVIHSSPEEPGLKQLKRVVALGRDTVGMRAGKLMVNGVPANEPYVTSLASMHGADPDQRAAMLKWQEPLLTQPDSVSLHPDLNDWDHSCCRMRHCWCWGTIARHPMTAGSGGPCRGEWCWAVRQ